MSLKPKKKRKGKPHSEETKAKISAAQTGKSPSKETRAKIRTKLTGIIRSEETKTKMRESWTPERKDKKREDTIGEKHPMYGKTHTEEAKTKQREAWTSERKAEESASKTGERNPSWIDGRRSDPQYKRRYDLRRFGLPEDFIEAALHQKKKRTGIEMVIEYWLINHGVLYEFQKHIDLPSTHTTIDFFVEPNFCIYVDGHIHQNPNYYGENRQDKDITIDKELIEMGFAPLRLWHRDILDGDRPWLVLDMPQPKHKQQSLESRE